MAEDLVLNAISILKSLYDDEVNLFHLVDTERKKLESNLSAINSVLQDAENRQIANTSDALNNWLQKLKNVVYELDDILDECTTESIRDEFEGDRSCSFLGFLHPHKVMFRHNISAKIKVVREELEFIAQEKDQFNFLLAERQTDVDHSNIPQWRQTTYLIDEDEIFGRGHDKEIIVRHLLEGASNGDTLCVYPIVGMGGLGKTALAQLVYGDERVTMHFELRKWVCVSKNFDLKTLLKAITKSNESPFEIDELVKKLQGILKGKRYLIVLDDVWNGNPDKWMDLRRVLACGSRGSTILITTRLEMVAMMMKAPHEEPYHLKSLPEDDCWQVFRKRAFGSSIVQEKQNLVSIGKDIARKCKGVPLAAKTLGGLLMFESDETFWIKIRDNELWRNLPEEEGSIFAALRLSYLNLSSRSRRCFSFCSIVPKGRVISKMKLIHLWMANGLISKGPSTTLELEDIGEMVVNELYWRSLIQDVTRDYDSGSIRNFKMHDLVHDLAQSISGHESGAMEGPSSTNFSPTCRHISITYYEKEPHKIYHLLENFKSLRSLVFLHCSDPVALLTSHSLKHTGLRVLDWSGLSNKVRLLPASMGVLRHLRYLNLAFSNITELPDSIGSLWNLQTLNISHCFGLKTFHASIGRLKNLRHLCNDGCKNLSSMPQNMVELISLRTFNLVVVGSEFQKIDQFQLSGLEHLKYLRGQITIEHLERVKDVKDAEKANLIEKQDLHYLCLTWSDEDGGGGDNHQHKQIHILEALRPPPRLRQLEMIGYKGIHFSNWMRNEITSLTYLQSLYLISCKNCTMLPPLWTLSSLKKLELHDLPNVRYFIERHEDSCGEDCVTFPALEDLFIVSLPRLEKMMFEEEANQELKNKNCIIFPRLSKLFIMECPKLNSFTSGPLPSLRSLQLHKSERIMLSMLTSTSYNLNNLNSLVKLTISSFDSIESFPDQMFQGLASLRKLTIDGCSKLKSFPESIKYLSSLVELRIFSCRQLKDLSIDSLQLTSLKKLHLRGLSLESLDTTTPELTDLSTLKYLELEDFPKLVSLPNWMSHLVSLEELTIMDSPELISIPNTIQQLSNLEKLYITRCSKLEQRCEKNTGQDWHKIAHIPEITIRSW